MYAGFLLSSLLWWVMGVCSLETQVTDTKTDSQGQDTDPNVFNTTVYVVVFTITLSKVDFDFPKQLCAYFENAKSH